MLVYLRVTVHVGSKVYPDTTSGCVSFAGSSVSGLSSSTCYQEQLVHITLDHDDDNNNNDNVIHSIAPLNWLFKFQIYNPSFMKIYVLHPCGKTLT